MKVLLISSGEELPLRIPKTYDWISVPMMWQIFWKNKAGGALGPEAFKWCICWMTSTVSSSVHGWLHHNLCSFVSFPLTTSHVFSISVGLEVVKRSEK